MFFAVELLVGIGVFCFLLWKYFINPIERIRDESHLTANVKPRDINKLKKHSSVAVNNTFNHYNLPTLHEDDSTNEEIEVLNVKEIKFAPESFETDTEVSLNSLRIDEISENITEKTRKITENNITENETQNEKFVNFVEKQILSEEKLQAIIQNLSLHESNFISDPVLTETFRCVDNHLNAQIKNDTGDNVENETCTSLVEEKNILKDKHEDAASTSVIEDKKRIPVKKTLKPGLPGLDFGSVIGELKKKTENGLKNNGLKPVFKKFDQESVNSFPDDQDTLNQAVDDNKKIHIDDNELGSNILAERRNKLETAAQGWRKRVPQTDAALFSVAGRLERDKASPGTPPPTPPAAPASPGVPQLNKFRSRKQPSPPGASGAGPLRSASCAAVGALARAEPPAAPPAALANKDHFKRSQSVTENIADKHEGKWSEGAGAGASVAVPRADDETFTSFFKSASQTVVASELLVGDNNNMADADLDAIDKSGELLVSNANRRARLVNRRAASRNPLRALAARSDLREEYTQQPSTGVADRERRRVNLEKVASGCGLAAEALAALAAKEDFSSVALRSGYAAQQEADRAHKLMLLQVKGRRRVQTRLIEAVHTNVNRGDCFVLVTPDQVFLYMGYYANVIERSRGSDIALHIHNHKDLGCKNSTGVTTIDEHANNFSNKHWNQFWGLLGAPIDKGEYKPIETGHPDEDEIFESTIIQTNMCYELMDDELVPIKEFWGQVPKISMLSPSKVIVFDFGSEMYIWNGKNVPLDKRRLAAQLAQELFEEGYNYQDCHVNPLTAASYQGARQDVSSPAKTANSRPEWAVLTKVTQHMENILFREKFLDWPDFTRVIKVKNQENKTSNNEIAPCDAEEMLARPYEEPDLILEGSHVGRGTHYYDKETMRHFDIKTKSVSKWVIQEYDYQRIENEAEIPEFYSGDSYIIRWEYQITVSGRELNGKPSKHNLTGRDRCAYFCWQGKDASSNEKGTAALLTVELDKEKGPQVRVTQGSEPPAFLNLFRGRLVIHQGKRDADRSRFRLYVARGNVADEAYLLQVPCSMRQLRSRASLVLADTRSGSLYVWHGARALKHTRQVAVELANRLILRKSAAVSAQAVEEVKEGEEPRVVLEGLGGANRQFYDSLEVSVGAADATPRLFHFTDLGGRFEANEVLSPLRHADLVTPFPFEQKELYSASQPALFMLDDGSTVWLWQGWWPDTEDESEAADRKAGVGAFAARWQAMRGAALATSAAYWSASGRAGKPDVRLVVAGLEPLTFTNLFHCWLDQDDVAQINIQYGYKAGETLSGLCELSRLNSSSDVVLPLAALQQRPLPEDVDPEHLEKHLSSVDFQEAFSMTREEYSELPAWKQANLKKDLGLF